MTFKTFYRLADLHLALTTVPDCGFLHRDIPAATIFRYLIGPHGFMTDEDTRCSRYEDFLFAVLRTLALLQRDSIGMVSLADWHIAQALEHMLLDAENRIGGYHGL